MKKLLLRAGAALLINVALVAAPTVAAQESGEAKITCKGKFIRFSMNYNVYLGEAEAYFHSIPPAFDGYKMTARNLLSTKPIEFKVKKAGLVRIMAAGLPVARLRSEGWTEIDSVQLENPDGEFSGLVLIFEKRLDVGSYSLPSDGNFGIRLLLK